MRSKAARTRLRLLILLGAIVIGGALFFRHYWLYRPNGDGPAGPPVFRTSFEKIWSERPVLLVGLGDSVTAWFGAEPKELSYFNRLLRNPEDEFPGLEGICLSAVLPKLQSNNLSVSGSTSIQHITTILSKLETQDPETYGVIVMTTGGNDIIHNYGLTPPEEGAMYGASLTQAQPWIESFRARLNQMIDEIEARFPGGCCIFLATIYDPTDGIGDTLFAGLPRWPDAMSILAAYNRIITDCADQRTTVHRIDMHDEFLGHGIHSQQFWRRHYDPKDPFYWYYDNLEDPNNRGYDAIRRLFLNRMAEVLPQLLADPAP